LEVLAGMKKKKVKAEARRTEDMPGWEYKTGYIDTSRTRPPRPVFRGRNIQGDVRGERER
jgi:hypothetical protein